MHWFTSYLIIPVTIQSNRWLPSNTKHQPIHLDTPTSTHLWRAKPHPSFSSKHPPYHHQPPSEILITNCCSSMPWWVKYNEISRKLTDHWNCIGFHIVDNVTSRMTPLNDRRKGQPQHPLNQLKWQPFRPWYPTWQDKWRPFKLQFPVKQFKWRTFRPQYPIR